MNTKILFGLALVAVLTIAVASPTVVGAITGIEKTEIKVKNGEIDKLKFHLDDKVEKPTFGGYAIFTTGGEIVAYTSHATVYDSTSQTAPTSDEILIQVGAIAAVCDSEDACGGEWHSHLVVADFANPYCETAAISELSFNEPASNVKADGKHVQGKDIAIGTGGFVGAISGQLMDFTVGDPLPDGVAFPLKPAFDAGSLSAICIGETTGYEAPIETELLCADISDAGSGLAYRDAVGVGGSHDKIELSEFPYSESLFNTINTNTGDVSPEGLGGVELQTWYDDNCS